MAPGDSRARGPMNFFPWFFGMFPSADDMVPAASGAPKLGLGCAGRSPMAVGLEYPMATATLLGAAASEPKFPE